MTHSTCNRCLLSTKIPGVDITVDGVCSVCKSHDRLWGDWNIQKDARSMELEKILESAKRKKGLYDVVVPVSGGKDSIYVLYLCRKKYRLKCLAVTWDNGFLSDHAKDNIKRACDILGVDHFYFGLSDPLLMRLYRYFFLKTGFFCPVCMRGIYTAQLRAQVAFDVPLAITGTSQRTEEHVSPEYFMRGDDDFMFNVLGSDSIGMDASVLMDPKAVSLRIDSPVYHYYLNKVVHHRATYFYLNLPDYMDWNYEEVFRVITSELGWRAHLPNAEHTDCKVDNIVHYFRYVKYPVLVPELLRFSKMVTAGQMTKEEALHHVAEAKSVIREPMNLTWFMNKLDITRQELDDALSNPLRHMQYIGKPPQWRALAKKLKYVFRATGAR